MKLILAVALVLVTSCESDRFPFSKKTPVTLVDSRNWTNGQYVCYSCTSCAPTLLSFLYGQVTCPAGEACYKEIESNGDVNRGCTNETNCGVKAILRGNCSGDSGPCLSCCYEDQCNGSTMANISIATMMLSLLAAVARMGSASCSL